MTIDTQPEAAVEAPEPAPAPRRWRRWLSGRRPLALLLALGFFFGPWLALAVGERPQEIENRRLRAMPSLSDGWRFFPDFAGWAVDHLPLRKQAVHGNAALSERVFNEPPAYGNADAGAGPVAAGLPGNGKGNSQDAQSPSSGKYPKVIQGTDGWLYFGGDVSNPCEPARSVADTLARLNRLAKAVDASGRRLIFTIAPDKSSVWPSNLPRDYLGKGCATARTAEFWRQLAAAPPRGYVDMRSVIIAAQKTRGEMLYRQTDTHWGELGAALYAESLARALQRNLWTGSRIVPRGMITRTGDLGVLIGRPHVDQYPGYTLVRPGVVPGYQQVPDLPFGGPIRLTSTTSGVPLFAKPTLLLGDSFTNSARNTVPRLFADVSLLHNEIATARPQLVADAMVSSEVVVYEIVERAIVGGRGALLDEKALRTIEATLAAHPRSR